MNASHLMSMVGFSIDIQEVVCGGRVTRSLVFCLMFCRSLFVLLFFLFWTLCFLSIFDLRILITLLVSSNSSSEL
jgi:hypothetical protein